MHAVFIVPILVVAALGRATLRRVCGLREMLGFTSLGGASALFTHVQCTQRSDLGEIFRPGAADKRF